MSKKSYRKYAATTMAVAVAASAVAPVVAGAEESDFSDVSEKSPHYEAIKAMAEAGIIQGDLVTGKFNPYDNVYRVQVAKMLQRALDLEVPANADEIIKDYTDITANYTKEDRDAIAAVTAAKIFQGDTKTGKFNAWTPINREQMASVIVRAYQLHNVDADHVDVNLSNVDTSHKASVQILANLGLTTELSDYRPADPTNREQFASFLHRTIEKVGAPDTPVYELEVKSVSAITNTSVTVDITELAEDLKDANVVVRDAAGQVVPTKATDLKAGAKTATFAFENPLTSSPTTQWTVNGVAYEAVDFAIVDVEALTNNGKYIEVLFNKPIKSLERSEVSIRETVSLSRVGVEAVDLSADGMSAQVTLLGSEDLQIMTPNTDYTVSITQDGKVTSGVFQIPAFIEEQYIEEVDSEERTITIQTATGGVKTLNIPEDTSFDFEHALGREATVWFNKNEDVQKYVLSEQTVKYDAVEFKTSSGNLVAKLKDEDKEYRVDTPKVKVIKDNDSFSVSAGEKLAYAKLVFNNANRVVAVVGVEKWDDSILVESTEDDAVLGYEDEISLKDYTIVKDGRTIKVSDIEANDIVYYNDEAEYAEVYTNTVTGKIDEIYNNEIEVNGTVYKVYQDDKETKYIEDEKTERFGSSASKNKDTLESFQKGGDVTLFLDRNGDVSYLTGDLGEVVSSTQGSYLLENGVGYKQATRDYLQLEFINEKGEEKLEDIRLDQLDFIKVYDGVNENKYQVGKKYGSNGDEELDKFEFINVDSEDGSFTSIVGVEKNNSSNHIVTVLEAEFDKKSVVEVVYDDNDRVIGLEINENKGKFNVDASGEVDDSTKKIKLTDSYITLDGGDAKRISKSTPVFWVEDAEDEEYEATTWGELSGFDEISKIDTIYFNKDNDITYLVIDKADTNIDADVEETAAVINAVRMSGDDIVRVDAWINGKLVKNIKVDEIDINATGPLSKGDLVTLLIDEKTGEVVAKDDDKGLGIQKRSISAEFEGLTGRNLTVTESGQEETYRLTSDLVVYEYLGSGDVKVRTISDIRNLNETSELELYTAVAGSSDVDVVVIKSKAEKIVFSSKTQTVTDNLGLTPADAKSDNSTVATAEVDSGAVKITSEAAGTATITVEDNSNNEATIDITVNADGSITIDSVNPYVTPGITSVTINEQNPTLTANANETVQLSADVVAVGGAAQTVTWSSSDETIATVDANTGLVTYVSGSAGDTVTITATSTVDGSKSNQVTVTLE